MHVLFAAAELAPLVKVGGLGEAACGLVRSLRRAGHRVDVVVPDYGPSLLELDPTPPRPVPVPAWAGPATVRRFTLEGLGAVHAVDVAGMARRHPYVHPDTGEGWADNDRRFFAFSQAVAALAGAWRPDVVHLNDWHTATTLAALDPTIPTVFTIHNLAYQGWADEGWLVALGPRAGAFRHRNACNPMAGAIRLADRIVAVSPTYAAEIRRPENGEGLAELLEDARDRLTGIRNGIDTERWDPATDRYLPAAFTAAELDGRDVCGRSLRRLAGFTDDRDPVIGVVARLVEQKGIDLALDLAPLLAHLPARMVLVGDGDARLVGLARAVAERHPDRVFVSPYGEEVAHLVAAGSDLMLVPSRFEPCGLTQMEAMAYGSIPVVNGVGGLRDTVIDADADPRRGNGFLADRPGPLHLMDAVHRALRAHHDEPRRRTLQQRAMRSDWSWTEPAAAYAAIYAAAYKVVADRAVSDRAACSPAPDSSSAAISTSDQPISLSTSTVCSPSRGALRNNPVGDELKLVASRT